MPSLQQIFRFLSFYQKATTQYRVHSPFVFDFTKEVLDDDRNYYAFVGIERLRKLMLKEKQRIKVTDYGAGSKSISEAERSIKEIVKHTAVSPFWGRVLFRSILHFRPKTLLELGTASGISTLYQAMAAGGDAQFIALEGCPRLAELAKHNFKKLEVNNVQIRKGRFEKTLPDALKSLKKLDYVFFDGNHQKEPTLNYFHQCLEYAHNESVFIFDDIYWSKEMTAAWQTIQQHPKVTLSIDLYFFGMVFFRKEKKTKEHFKLVPAEWKPWVMGFFE